MHSTTCPLGTFKRAGGWGGPGTHSMCKRGFEVAMHSSSDQSDVIVIGSCVGGGVIAKELGEAGLKVVVIEAGKRYRPYEDYPTHTLDFEIRARDTFSPEDPRRDLYTAPRNETFNYCR